MAFNKSQTFLRATLLAASACCAFSASAQLYKWTDENGKVHYSDTVPPSANDRARKEMRTDGTVKGQIERALSPEERRAAALKKAEDEKEQIAKSERDRKEKALLTSYSSIEEYDRVRSRDLAVVQGVNTSLENRIFVLQNQRAELLKVAPKNNAEKLTNEKQRTEVNQQLETLSRERDAAVKNVVDTKERFRVERELLTKLFAEQAAANKGANAPAPTQSSTSAAKKKS
jgi:hypothetical protein